MNRLIMSSSPQISYTVSLSIVLSSAVSDLSADGHEKNAVIFYFRTGDDAFSQKIERSLCIFFSDSCVLYSCSCHALLADFRTSVNLTGFHVFARIHVFAQVFYFRTGGDAFSQKKT